MSSYPVIPLPPLPHYDDAARVQKASEFYQQLKKRRTVREYVSDPVPREVIEQCLLAAGTAPSGANQQPWFFAVIESAELKRKVREAAEEEERLFYGSRASEEWLQALAPLGTDEHKPFLEIAPYLIVAFSQKWHIDSEGKKHKHYYVPESAGIACGMLITALHNAGLATLTHTPSPMGFLNKILERPDSERAEMIIVAGLPAVGVSVPDISKKALSEIAKFY